MNNIQAYNTIAKSKKVSELFLGTLKINWDFAKIGYSAICTESLPLTFMEKMVCGIVNLDGRVALSDLAHIMGLNIENDVQNLKFQDMGETEILLDTLRTLKQFGVIVTPDSSFSYVELTEIGKEYYAKGRKFKHGETKGFTMYFDLTAGKHSNARALFSKLTVDGSKDIEEQISDFVIKIGSEIYLLECQSYDDGSMAIRIAEYAFICRNADHPPIIISGICGAVSRRCKIPAKKFSIGLCAITDIAPVYFLFLHDIFCTILPPRPTPIRKTGRLCGILVKSCAFFMSESHTIYLFSFKCFIKS